jgi:hypothetical protein
MRLRRRTPGPAPPAAFVVGVPRSGTTLLRLMLDAHPELAIPPETYFVPELIEACDAGRLDHAGVVAELTAHPRWSDFDVSADELAERLPRRGPVDAGVALRAFYGAYAAHHGKRRWGDKTPVYLRHMRAIQTILPEARFVHVVRDGRDVALSVTGLLFGPDSVVEAARRWDRKIRRARRAAPKVAHYLEVRYEELVVDTEPALRHVCQFLELDWDEQMLEYHRSAGDRLAAIARSRPRAGREAIPTGYGPKIHALTGRPPDRARVGRWRTEMSDEDRAAYEGVAGTLLEELGYELGGASRPTDAVG